MASSSGTGHDATRDVPQVTHMVEPPVAAPDHAADTMPLLTIHGAALHAMAEGKPEEAAHITAILARRLREQAALLAERQQDKERIEGLQTTLDALAPTRPSRGYRPGLDDPALAVEEDAE